MLRRRLFGRLIRVGTLTIVDAIGRVHVFGDGSGPTATIRLHDRSLHWKLLVNLQLHAGEAYTDGTLTVAGCSLVELMALVCVNMQAVDGYPIGRLRTRWDRIVRRLHQLNVIGRANANAAHRYDLSDVLYRLFLDDAVIPGILNPYPRYPHPHRLVRWLRLR